MNEFFPYANAHPVEVGLVVLGYLVALPLALVWMRSQVRQAYESWLEEAELLATMSVPFDTSQPWREKTDIRLLEDLKQELAAKEKALIEARSPAAQFLARRDRGSTRSVLTEISETWRARRVLGFYKRRSYLCEQLDRLWAGDAHLEIEDRKDNIQRLNRERTARAASATVQLKQLDEKILTTQRELRDLDEIVLRARARVKVSPHQSQYERSREIHELDTQAKIKNKFLPVRSQMETLKEQRALIQLVTDDVTFTPEQKERLIALINVQAATVSETAPVIQPKPGSIYKAGG